MKKTIKLLSLLVCNISIVSARDSLVRRKYNVKNNHLVPEDRGTRHGRKKSIKGRRKIMEIPTLAGHLGKGKGSVMGKGGKGGKGKGLPYDDFNLAKCDTYYNTWIMDLNESCVGSPLENSFEGCQCHDAQHRIKSGEIVCGRDMCPEGCEVCKTCLYYVIDDCLGIETVPPTKAPTAKPTKAPTQNPSSAPPTPNPTSSPTEDTFDLSVCSTYSLMWLLDLRSSCDGLVEEDDLTGCQCYDAKKRLGLGQLTCDSVCPDDCDVCKLCLNYLVGC